MHEFHEYLDKRYALALYEVAEEKGKVEEYLKELDELHYIINQNEDLLCIITHPDLSTSKKKELFESIFKNNIENDILAFLIIIIEKNRFDELKDIITEIKKIHLERCKVLSAVVTTVVPLTEDERTSLIAKLKNKYNKSIILDEQLDRDIIGGVHIRVGNDIIDGTIKGKINKIRRMTLKTD